MSDVSSIEDVVVWATWAPELLFPGAQWVSAVPSGCTGSSGSTSRDTTISAMPSRSPEAKHTHLR